MIRFYMDVNARGEMTRGLRKRGVDVLTAQEDGQDETADPELLTRAGDLGRVMISADADMLAEAHRRQDAGESFSGILYYRQRTAPVGRSVEDLEVIAKAGEPEDLRNRVIFFPMRSALE